MTVIRNIPYKVTSVFDLSMSVFGDFSIERTCRRDLNIDQTPIETISPD